MRACRKHGYRSRLDAKIALADIHRPRRHSRRDAMERRVYRCHLCNRYHLTSQEKRSA